MWNPFAKLWGWIKKWWYITLAVCCLILVWAIWPLIRAGYYGAQRLRGASTAVATATGAAVLANAPRVNYAAGYTAAATAPGYAYTAPAMAAMV